MFKKDFLLFLLVPTLFVSLIAVSPDYAEAAWFGEKSFAATFTSFFSKVKSLVTSALTLKEKPPAVVQANCIPPVPPKPAGIDFGSKYGSLNITPEASTAGTNNVITISANTNLDPTKTITFWVPIPTNKNDLIDWHPKDQSVINFNQANYDSEKRTGGVYGWGGTYGWGIPTALGNEKNKLPADQIYWVKIRTRHSTIPERAKDATAADGWRKIEYLIGNTVTSGRGSQWLYVGREQKPSLITTIPNYSPTAHTLSGGPNFLKPFTLIPNEYFEIQTKSLGQPGTITMDVKYGKVLGDTKRRVRADETITWKIQPLRFGPVLLRELGLVNTCGEDYFVDPAQTARLSELDQFKFPVAYDFEKLKAEQVDLSIGARGDHKSLMAGPGGLFAAFANLSTKGDTKIPVPGVPVTFRAVYADNPKETVKSLIFKSYDNEKENAGEFTINTLKDSTGIGSAYVRMLGPNLTAEDAKRGIVLVTTVKKFPGLSAQMTVPIVVPKTVPPQPKPVTPQPKSESPSGAKTDKVSAKNLVIIADRKLEGLKESDKVIFTAKLVMSDGSTQVVRTGAKWTLIGQVGSITPEGLFSAKLDEAVAEYGEGSGIVTATYIDAQGTTFLGKTPTFRVEAFIPDDANMGG